MRKIGILTYLREYANMGTNMQSFCTLKAIQKQFPNDRVELINYSGWKPAMKPYLSQVSLISLLNDYNRIKKYIEFFKKSYVFSPQKLISSNCQDSLSFIRDQRYDVIFVGSDTILELKRAHKDELTAYWLNENISSKKIMIAASAHNVTFENLSSQQKEKIQMTVNDFGLLGVRDESTYRLLSHFIKPEDQRLQLVPDPTFTFNIDYNPIEKYMKKKNWNPQKPIVCLHLLRNSSWAATLACYFKKAGYLVASLRPAYYADVIFTDLAILEQVGLYKYFDLMITHRFHDAIFCLKNLTPVIVFPECFSDVTQYGENKNKTLFKSFDIESCYINNKNDLTAESLFEKHKQAISLFQKNKIFIQNHLEENKRTYEDFLKQSAKLLATDTPHFSNI